jgi:hypothetical protein
MTHRPVPTQPQPASGRTRRRILPTRRTLAALSGLAAVLTATIGLAPVASATMPPPPPATSIAPPPPTPAPPAFPLWAVVAILAGTVVLSAATALITLSLEHLRRARRTQPGVTASPGDASTGTPDPEAGQLDMISSHQYAAQRDR